MDEEIVKKQQLYRRLTDCRADLLGMHPFFGRLLLRLNFGFAPCGTAYTDMKNIVFDPDFGGSLSDDELAFVLLHELLHCVLRHCIRGRTLHHLLYNIACDIVINSHILAIRGERTFTVGVGEVMHLAPDGKEGREYTAEEVYAMLLGKYEESTVPEGAPLLDRHDLWETIAEEEAARLTDKWDSGILDAALHSPGNRDGIPDMLARALGEILRPSRVNWRQVLADFLRHNRSDYIFERPDTRFAGGDVILPSFCEDVYGEAAENVWILADTSASIGREELETVYAEIFGILTQLDAFEGKLSFFDTNLTKPRAFTSAEELMDIVPVGLGGTDFHQIFEAIPRFFPDEPPAAIIIITDGYSDFPAEDASLGIPVLWIMIDSDVDAPWGVTVHNA